MCCQDGDEAIWQTAGWSAGAEGSFFMPEQQAPEELPTAAAELMVMLVPIPDWVVVKGAVPPDQPAAEGSFVPEQQAPEELPTAAAELMVMLVPIPDWVVVKGAVPPDQPGAAV